MPESALDEFAGLLAERIGQCIKSPRAGRWMDAEEAAAYLGFDSVHPLRKLTAARRIEFSQEGTGGKMWFQQSALDAFRNRHLRPPLA